MEGRKKLGGFGRTPEEFPVQWECLAKTGGGEEMPQEERDTVGLLSAVIARTMTGR